MQKTSIPIQYLCCVACCIILLSCYVIYIMTYCCLFRKTSSFQNRCIAFSGLGHLHEYVYLQRYQYSHLWYFHFCRGNKGLPTYIFTGNIDINGVRFFAKIIFVVSYCFSIALALLSSIEIKDCVNLMGYLMLFIPL